jgi:hypothetical protein
MNSSPDIVFSKEHILPSTFFLLLAVGGETGWDGQIDWQYLGMYVIFMFSDISRGIALLSY